jgi:hypothetical protein
VNLAKLVSNQIALTWRIENQWQFPLTKVVLLAFGLAAALYLYGVHALLKQAWSAVGLSLFHFFFAAWTIAAATIIFGDPIMLRPIGVAGFLINAHFVEFGIMMIAFPSLPWMPRIDPECLKRPVPVVVDHAREVP